MKLDDETAVRLRAAFPAALRDDVDAVLKRLPTPFHGVSADDVGAVKVSGEPVSIPSRVYLPASALWPCPGLVDRLVMLPEQRCVDGNLLSRLG